MKNENNSTRSTGKGASPAPIPPTPENVRAALSYLSADCDGNEWWETLAAVADALGPDGRDIADEWSQTAPHRYDRASFRDSWRSACKPGPVTIGTLWGAALKAGWRPSGEAHQETEAERLEREQRRQEWEAQQAKHRAKKEREAARKAGQLFSQATPARADHPYLSRKGINPVSTLREIPVEQAADILGYMPKSDGEPLTGRVLLVPVKVAGKLATAELIDERGLKTAIAGGSKAGGYWAAQPLPEDDGAGLTLAIGEGVVTVLSVHQATGYPVIAALACHNLPKVAAIMREQYPAAQLLILADAGNGQKDAERAARETGAALAIPQFPEGAPGKDFNDLAALTGLAVVREQIGAAITPAPATDTPAAKTYTLLTFEDLAALPPMRWKVKGVLPDNGTAAIYGASGSGKSFLSLDLAGALGRGREWFGYRVTKSPVVYLCLEGESGLRNRVAAYRSHHGGDSLAGVRFIVERFHILTEDPAALIRTVQAAGMESPVVMIDTLNRAAPGADENSGVDMGRIIEAAKVIQDALGGLVILVHHTGKDAGRGPRGHSSLRGALDAAIEVKRNGDSREWITDKAKDSKDGDGHPFTLKSIFLGEDEDGDPVTSCAILPGVSATGDGEGTSDQPTPKAPTGGNQKIAWDYLRQALKHREAIQLEEVIGEVRGRLTVEEKRKSERARAALTSLINAGLITLEHDLVSFPVPVPVPVPPIGGSGKTGKRESRNFPEMGKTGKRESAPGDDVEDF